MQLKGANKKYEWQINNCHTGWGTKWRGESYFGKSNQLISRFHVSPC